MRREVIEQVGLFDPRYFLYYEEVDHCLAAKRAGWRVVFFPHTQVVHLGGESALKDGPISASGRQVEQIQFESALLYYRKNFGLTWAAAWAALDILGDGILAAKDVLKRRGGAAIRAHASRAASVVRLVAHTRLGARPTR